MTKLGPTARQLFAQAEEQTSCVAPQTPAHMKSMRRAVASGLAVSPAQGVYARAAYWQELSAEQRAWHMMRALTQLHPSWTFAGPTAGLIHGLWVDREQLGTVNVATNRRAHSRSLRGIVRIITGNAVGVLRDGVRVTPFVRTVYDCVRMSGFGRALAIVDSAAKIKQISAGRLVHNLRQTCERLRGSRRVLSIAALADGRSDNGGESIARAAMMHLGFEVPDLQRKVPDLVQGGRVYYADFAWDLPNGTVVYGELDGRDKYLDPQMTGGADVTDVLLRERRREAHLTVGQRPVRVVRFSFADVCEVRSFGWLLESYGVGRAEHPVEVAREWP